MMSFKAFTLAAFMAVSQAVTIETTQKYLDPDFEMPQGLGDAVTWISIFDVDNDGLLTKCELRKAFIFFNGPGGDVDAQIDPIW